MKDLIDMIKQKKPKRVLLQLPEGLKTRAVEIANEIEKEGIEVILSAEPCYGACDLPDNEASLAECDLIVHVGHKKFYRDIKTKVPVLYYPWSIHVELGSVDFSPIKENKIGLITTVQHEGMLEGIAKKLEKAGKKAIIGGTILGCYADVKKITDKVDAFLFVGSGRFHPLALKGKVYCLDLERMKIETLNTTLFEKSATQTSTRPATQAALAYWCRLSRDSSGLIKQEK